MSKIRHQQRRVAQKKHGKAGALNLVSLMDIFTILVFFLMVNSSEVEVLQTSSKIKLPDSTSEQRPENQLVISISRTTWSSRVVRWPESMRSTTRRSP